MFLFLYLTDFHSPVDRLTEQPNPGKPFSVRYFFHFSILRIFTVPGQTRFKIIKIYFCILRIFPPGAQTGIQPSPTYNFFLFGEFSSSMTNRICLHLKCLIHRPRNWKFYLGGIWRELSEFFPKIFLAFTRNK